MKILLIEDDKKTAAFILKALSEAGYTTAHAGDGKNGLYMAKNEPFDLAIIDVMLPLVDGFTVLEGIRHAGISAPVIILSARNSIDDKVRGLHAGGDVYLVKPFSVTELLANKTSSPSTTKASPRKSTKSYKNT